MVSTTSPSNLSQRSTQYMRNHEISHFQQKIHKLVWNVSSTYIFLPQINGNFLQVTTLTLAVYLSVLLHNWSRKKSKSLGYFYLLTPHTLCLIYNTIGMVILKFGRLFASPGACHFIRRVTRRRQKESKISQGKKIRCLYSASLCIYFDFVTQL